MKNLKHDIELYKKLIDLIYKILYYIEIPTFKRDQYDFYQLFLKKCIDDEQHSNQKHKTLYNLIKIHCASTIEVINQIKIDKK